jgi:hypothetical protein
MDLTLQELGSLGEFVGAMVVVVTLIYFTVQLKQATNSIRSSVAAIGTGYTTQVWQLPIDKPEVADLIQKGNKGIDDLTENEFLRYHLFQGTVLRSFEQYFILYELGSLTEPQWNAWRDPLEKYLREPGVRQCWELLKGQHVPGFTDLVENILEELPPDETQGLFFHRPRTAEAE